LYGFELGTTWHGNPWWYDEYDAAGTQPGYLGAPLGEAYLAAGPLTTSNLLRNPGFERPTLAPWTLHTDGAQAALERVLVRAPFSSTYAARINLTSTQHLEDVRLEQGGLVLTASESLNLSLWAKTSAPIWDTSVVLRDPHDPQTTYAGPALLRLSTTWQRFDLPLTVDASATDAQLSLNLGGQTGTVWIDEFSLQRGTLSAVYRRDFAGGVVLCNPAQEPQTIELGGEYCKLVGDQAPRFKIIVDDSERSTPEFIKIGGWAGHGPEDERYDDCWRDTYHHALTTQDPSAAFSSATWRPTLPFTDSYAISAWAVPCARCTHPVTYTVAHAAGLTHVTVDVHVDQPTWIDLGTYPLHAGTQSSVTLTNLSHSEWVVADAVKFESMTRYNDGACLRSLTLAPQDGIILRRGLHRLYLPLLLRN
jgi:hypothetical protein